MSQNDALHWPIRRSWQQQFVVVLIGCCGFLGMHGIAMAGSAFHVEHLQVTPQGDIENQHGMPTLYARWSEVVAALARVHDFILPLVHGAARGQVAVRVYIDILALPLPLRLRALLGHWKLESPWIVSAPLSH
ncbi:hypothetical protein Acife_0018 [Acidithiobacillus ferrivorans SS3]|jgi:hypothetical protein|uniref:Uncharacterized protein n=1 Tax=Acidithiobacillus ferrivorans SS3 TaxID=743299 RepID=G0JPM6_9PROT|nr:DUF4390 domain-containing protein [Acidithiobacillus ferrivorans]AEM46261.1 hypothetical protein Acife_0018 [Acidithiobacillus ferrivorans SS3]MBU2850271.1 DUF4390 domain-containing protein [Acidithiobacillus ferrivorans]